MKCWDFSFAVHIHKEFLLSDLVGFELVDVGIIHLVMNMGFSYSYELKMGRILFGHFYELSSVLWVVIYDIRDAEILDLINTIWNCLLEAVYSWYWHGFVRFPCYYVWVVLFLDFIAHLERFWFYDPSCCIFQKPSWNKHSAKTCKPFIPQ